MFKRLLEPLNYSKDYMNKQNKDILWIILVVLLAILVLGIGPFITVWSINALFSTSIAYSFKTWLAMTWVQAISFSGIISQLVQIKNKL